MRRWLGAIALLAVAGCSTVYRQLDREGTMIDSAAVDWRAVATNGDRQRLREWRTAFAAGLGAAKAAGAGTRIGAEGALLAPDAALPGPGLPNGDYACRTIKLGARNAGQPSFLVYPATTCRVLRGRTRQSLQKLSGSQRLVGRILPADALRSVFLGTLMVGDESRPMQYGSDPDRDLAGYVERIGTHRWRILLPRPAFQSTIDVMELVPAG